MKKIALSFALIISCFWCFSQSVTILPTTQLGGSGGGGPWTLNTTTNRALTNNGVEINRSSSTVASPDLFFRSPNTNIRIAGTTGEAGFLQSAIVNATPASATMSWVHLNSAATPVQTSMMTIDGEGDMTTFGFTKLGGSAADVPAIKHKLLTGTITAALATETSTSLTTSITHGIANWDKIISVDIILKGRILSANGNFDIAVPPRFNDNRPSPGGTNGFEFTYAIGTTNIEIIRNATNSNKLAFPASNNGSVPAYASPYRILITYTN